MESQNLEGFELIGRQQIAALATKARVSEKYVKYILTGEREHRSPRARAIWEAALALTKSLETGMKRAGRRLELCEND